LDIHARHRSQGGTQCDSAVSNIDVFILNL